jgi:hypothetical protein
MLEHEIVDMLINKLDKHLTGWGIFPPPSPLPHSEVNKME